MLVLNILYFQFFFCEILNLVVDLVNIYLTDFFLAGRFMKYEIKDQNWENQHFLRQVWLTSDEVSES